MFLLCQALVLTGELNLLAPLVTVAFLLTFSMINLVRGLGVRVWGIELGRRVRVGVEPNACVYG